MSIIENPTTGNTTVETLQRIFVSQQQNQWQVARSSASQRIEKLKRLHAAVLRRRSHIRAALQADFRKPVAEIDITELGVVLGEIRHAIRHLRRWMSPRRVATPMTLIGTASEILYEPKGVCLIISPWNFPFNLSLAPLVSAVAAGNCVMLKPSEFVPHSVAVLRDIVGECFETDEVALVEGDAGVSEYLTHLPFHHIFFTGSPAVGKMVMAAAAQNLCSVTLELGGKSPVVVDQSADLDTAAAKVVWLKCLNAGQTCIAPDYVLVEATVRQRFVQLCQQKIGQFYGQTPEARKQSADYPRLVNHRHFDRVAHLFEDALQSGADLRYGGRHERESRYFEPTILENVPSHSKIYTEEIFGPLLPVFSFEKLEEAQQAIAARPKALAMYIFSKNRKNIDFLLRNSRGSGVTLNDCGAHFYNPNLPFGGSNNSGIGKCHGEFGFQEFSNARGVLRQNTLFPTTHLFHPPYTGRLAKWLTEAVVKWF